ncbi:MAG TPA: peptidoglycan DD-metalloendopeptidase family protein [Patescibacteria group bacterium]|nr:peptidoglycan DD-metalloendopeptidase family protein [Patescibacteria group bacterium]
MNSLLSDLRALFKSLVLYQAKKTARFAKALEGFKNKAVEILMHRRGRLQKYFFHASMLGLVGIGLLSSGIFGSEAILVKSFPGVGEPDPTVIETFDPNASGLSLKSLIDFKTSVSEKPRSEIIEYEVADGDTLSSIAGKFGVTQETIKWANDMESVDTIKPGQKLKILPVSGVSHTVKSGDTLESVAKKYDTGSQGILDFPFNDVPDDFKLQVGQVLIVPDGIPPEAKATPKPKLKIMFAQGPQSTFRAPGGGNFMWPTSFQMISTNFAWWHPGIDMANRSAPAVAASDGGTVVVAGWPDNYGYGNRVVIDHGNGYQTLYAHLSNIYVSVGQSISRGQSVGQMGSTGRSTGTHLHFEIRYKGIAVNPLAILK